MVSIDHETGSLLLTVEEAARELRVSRSTMFKLIGSGEVPSLRLGNNARRVRRADLEDYVAQKIAEQGAA